MSELDKVIDQIESNAALAREQKLRGEIERLRAALQAVIDQGETVCLWDAQQIARRALEDK